MEIKDTTLAAILSFIMPGLGQAYAGKVGRGILVFILSILGYFCLILPGIFVWLWNIFDARDQAREYNKKKVKS